MSASAGLLITAQGVSKRFGGIHALTNVSFEIARGTVYGLIGPNGAGKTTLFNLLTGLYTPDSGRFLLDGTDITGWTAHDVVRQGIARTFQNIRLFANLSAVENVMIGRHCRTRSGIWGAMLQTRHTREEERDTERRALEYLDFVGLKARANERAGALAYGDQRRLEIARALATEPKLLALDEPAAGMNNTETAALRDVLELIRARGITTLLIEHDVKLVMNVCDRVLVLDHGERLAEGLPVDVQRDPRVIEAYLGTPAPAIEASHANEIPS